MNKAGLYHSTLHHVPQSRGITGVCVITHAPPHGHGAARFIMDLHAEKHRQRTRWFPKTSNPNECTRCCVVTSTLSMTALLHIGAAALVNVERAKTGKHLYSLIQFCSVCHDILFLAEPAVRTQASP